LIRRLAVDFVGVERLYVVFEDDAQSVYLGTVHGIVTGTPVSMGVGQHAALIRRTTHHGQPSPRRIAEIARKGAAGIDTAVAVPLTVGRETVGTIVVENLLPETGGWTEHSWDLLQDLADQAAPALMTAALYRKASTLAVTDGLTGLFNHRHFHEKLAEEWLRADRYHKPLSVLLIEADDFKKVNDTYGHLQGDSVLRDLAMVLQRNVRDVDVTARYGGDEFTAILPETDAEGALTVAERVRQAVEEFPFPSEEGTIHMTVSVGVASHPPIMDRNALVRAADDALYIAKRRGKNRIVSGV
jgi:diguanylate cyclase (GGDEF)-like protein